MTLTVEDNRQRLRARAEAYREAAGHLELTWTEIRAEIIEGRKLAKEFFRRADQIDSRADELLG